MKQRITLEQWEEISQNKMLVFYNTVFVTRIIDDSGVEHLKFNRFETTPIVSEIIEFLGHFLVSIETICPDNEKPSYRVKVKNKDYLFLENELVDGLWEAAKLKLALDQA